jgi:spermidine synthase
MANATYPSTTISPPAPPAPLRAPVMSAAVLYPTAVLEGASVIIIELAGARALAPFFGTSHQVWTAQITVTLLFLALGYGMGGLLAKRIGGWTLPALFGIAGLWTALYPILRSPVLDNASAQLGVAAGSLTASAALFGPPLLMLGAVSPVLIAYIDQRRPGAGSAAGRLFFTNTIGGLVGGWVTAFALIPYCSLRVSLVATGVGLVVLALFWALIQRSPSTIAALALLVASGYVLLFVHPHRSFKDKYGNTFEMLHSAQSGIGLLQVMDTDSSGYPDEPQTRRLLINGVTQGEMNRQTGRSVFDYIHYVHLVAHSLHPNAKSALQLGLGAGLLPKELTRRGLKVTAVEIEPQMVTLARQYFDLPAGVDVRLSDARSFLRHDTGTYDLIVLDTFASETTAWYLMTKEAFEEMRARLNPGGRLLINTVTYANPAKPSLGRIEATLRAVFPDVMLFPEPPPQGQFERDPEMLINTTIAAGEHLRPQMVVPGPDYKMTSLAALVRDAHAAVAAGEPLTDDLSDLDYAQASVRARWRTLIWSAMDSNQLAD